MATPWRTRRSATYRAVGALSCLAWALLADDAAGFCRTTTCDVSREPCARDAQGCALDGNGLAWSDGCLRVGVEGGSQLRGISVGDVASATANALATWSHATCGRPGVGAWGPAGPALAFDVRSLERGSSLVGGSAVRFRDRDWPHHDLHTNVALTTLTIEKSTGVIVEAAVELNSFSQPFFSDGSSNRYDLELVLLHEMGHVLGLSHSGVESSRMTAEYGEPEDRRRWLSNDDEQGVCSAYPPTRTPSCVAPGGTPSLCETLEECRWVALVMLSMCWAVFGVLWRYRYRVCYPPKRPLRAR